MSTLDWITVKGFKSIKSIEELELRPINILIGANGAGKSNFIGVFSFLNAIRLGEVTELRDAVRWCRQDTSLRFKDNSAAKY